MLARTTLAVLTLALAGVAATAPPALARFQCRNLVCAPTGDPRMTCTSLWQDVGAFMLPTALLMRLAPTAPHDRGTTPTLTSYGGAPCQEDDDPLTCERGAFPLAALSNVPALHVASLPAPAPLADDTADPTVDPPVAPAPLAKPRLGPEPYATMSVPAAFLQVRGLCGTGRSCAAGPRATALCTTDEECAPDLCEAPTGGLACVGGSNDGGACTNPSGCPEGNCSCQATAIVCGGLGE